MNFTFSLSGLLWIECKQIYSCGAKEHFRQYYNYMDFSIIALYMASYSLRFVAVYRIHQVINTNTRRMYSSRMRTVRCSGRLSCHACPPLPCMPPATHVHHAHPCHTCPLAMHTPPPLCQAHPLHHAPFATHTPLAMHAPLCHACPLPRGQTDACENITYAQLLLLTINMLTQDYVYHFELVDFFLQMYCNLKSQFLQAQQFYSTSTVWSNLNLTLQTNFNDMIIA